MDGIAKVGTSSEVEIARGRTRALQILTRCEDPVHRNKLAIYVGTRNNDGIGRWYVPKGSAWRFFEDGIFIFPVAGKRKAFLLESGFVFDGAREFRIYQNGYDSEFERNFEHHELPDHFHWCELNPKNPTVHCSTEKGDVWARAAFVTVEHLSKG